VRIIFKVTCTTFSTDIRITFSLGEEARAMFGGADAGAGTTLK